MHITPLQAKSTVDVGIKYRRMLNKLNLETRERIETLNMYYPFDTIEKREALKAIEDWKQRQKTIIFDRCYNPQPSFIERVISIFKK